MKDNSIVILHGWGLSAATFLPLSRELRRHHFNVYTPDFPGFASDEIPSHPYTLMDYAMFLETYLSKKGIRQPILIGHSFGGRVALKFQELYPKQARAMILTGTPGFTPISRKKLMFFIGTAKIGGLFFSLPLFSRIKNRVRVWYYYLVGARDFYRAQGVMRETFKNVVKEPLARSMQGVQVPTLLVWGDDDAIVPLRVAHRMKEVIPHALLISLPGQGHGVPFKNPRLFTNAILPWIARL